MSFNFRLRFKFSDGARLPVDSSTMVLDSAEPVCVYLSSLSGEKLIKESADAALFGQGYSTVEEAELAGLKWRDILQTAFARLNIGADFGEISGAFGSGGLSDDAKKIIKERTGRPVYNDRPGVIVYGDPRPLFFAASAHGRVTPSVRRMKGTFEVARTLDDLGITDTERLAYDLYAASFFDPSADARLLMAMMAVETLIDPKPRSPEVREVVSQLVRHVKESGLPKNEVSSLLGSLRWLDNESIGQAGRRLVGVLDGRTYNGMSPAKFFTHCYTLRSALVHGHLARPNRPDVDMAASNLQLLVSELLSLRVLHVTDEWAQEHGLDNEPPPSLGAEDAAETLAAQQRQPTWLRRLVVLLGRLRRRNGPQRPDGPATAQEG